MAFKISNRTEFVSTWGKKKNHNPKVTNALQRLWNRHDQSKGKYRVQEIDLRVINLKNFIFNNDQASSTAEKDAEATVGQK